MEGEIVPTLDGNQRDAGKEIEDTLTRGYGPRIARFAMAVLGGAIPVLGTL